MQNSGNFWDKVKSSTKTLAYISSKEEKDGDATNSTVVHNALVKFYEEQVPFQGFPGWLGPKEDLPDEQKILRKQERDQEKMREKEEKKAMNGNRPFASGFDQLRKIRSPQEQTVDNSNNNNNSNNNSNNNANNNNNNNSNIHSNRDPYAVARNSGPDPSNQELMNNSNSEDTQVDQSNENQKQRPQFSHAFSLLQQRKVQPDRKTTAGMSFHSIYSANTSTNNSANGSASGMGSSGSAREVSQQQSQQIPPLPQQQPPQHSQSKPEALRTQSASSLMMRDRLKRSHTKNTFEFS
ncbi:hypothetical protein TBLA_0F00200 [Henningerozyma blattae CBS 6284]|uniref:Mso1 N-terminal domain-containing protein n=1 Tax=Henningerozyma blattae (strain ATCC 34711 / CBS 6284 / DSM 70876 / NBRC 10599 / NRRL Y-10934 / UCD 77-7) TaxID=1071380 RepID=I2H5B2_HENB6|nr:hypothetical protein TBLA_0F00200 [Tetrapisispora blattae CBS 6284]CCH61564.1 hypothetical protein TBLA_0F00200 [Tetrapisispora blattae CBS 6284]